MSVLIDLLGALMIATMLLLMMITFQLQLRDTADRTIFAAQMMTHVQRACHDLNGIIALAGIKMPTDSVTVVTADSTVFAFRTFWDFTDNCMTLNANTLSMELEADSTSMYAPTGFKLNIIQSAPILELQSILWLENLSFSYYDINNVFLGKQIPDAETRKKIYSVDVNMTFRRDPPDIRAVPLRTRVQLRCHLMNRYLTYIP